jgi:hypothetical protein
MGYQFPLKLSFKLIAMAPKIYIHDANGQEIFFVKQKVWNLKEDVRIYSDSSESNQIFNINADRIIDFSANYNFTDSRTQQPLGKIKRKGMRSLWQSTYQVSDSHEKQTHFIREDNPWAKVGDSVLGNIPFLGFISGYVFHPTYTAYVGNDRNDLSSPVMRLEKQPAFWEGVFTIEKLDNSISEAEEQRLLLSFFMMIQLERRRG